MRPLTFRRYLYSDTLHTFIMQSDEAETNDLQTLHKKYGIDSGENMLLTSASDSGTAGSKLVPSVLQQGDIATMEYYQTPYGKFVEMMNEQLTHIVL